MICGGQNSGCDSCDCCGGKSVRCRDRAEKINKKCSVDVDQFGDHPWKSVVAETGLVVPMGSDDDKIGKEWKKRQKNCNDVGVAIKKWWRQSVRNKRRKPPRGEATLGRRLALVIVVKFVVALESILALAA